MTAATPTAGPTSAAASVLGDPQVIARVLDGRLEDFELLMRRYNRRVFRVVRGIVRDDAAAEDVTQEAWLAAYRSLARFEGRSAFPTWLTRIAIRKAISHLRRGASMVSLDELDGLDPRDDRPEPEVSAHRAELARILERAIDDLPPSYRLVVMLRDVEHMTTSEAAEALDVREENVRVRLHRARQVLRERLVDELGAAAVEVFGFDGERCDRMVAGVMAELRAEAASR